MFMAYVYWELTVNHGLADADRAARSWSSSSRRCRRRRSTGSIMRRLAGQAAGRAAHGHGRADVRASWAWPTRSGTRTRSHAMPVASSRAAGFQIGDVIRHVAPVHDDRRRARARGRRCGSCCSAPGSASPCGPSSTTGRSPRSTAPGPACVSSFVVGARVLARRDRRHPARPRDRHGRHGPLTLLIITAFAAAVVGRLRSLPLTYLGALILALAIAVLAAVPRARPALDAVPAALPTIMLFFVAAAPARRRSCSSRRHRRRSRRTTGVDRCATPRSAWRSLVVVMADRRLAASLERDRRNINRLALGMCTALDRAVARAAHRLGRPGVARAARVRRASARSRTRSSGGATAASGPIVARRRSSRSRRRGPRASRAAAAGPLPRARDARVRGGGRVRDLHASRFARFAGERTSSRLHVVRPRLLGDRSRSSCWSRRCSVFASVGVVALRRSAFGRRSSRIRDSEAASATVGVNIIETKLIVFIALGRASPASPARSSACHERHADASSVPDARRARRSCCARHRRRRRPSPARCSPGVFGLGLVLHQGDVAPARCGGRSSSSARASPRSASSRTRRARSSRSATAFAPLLPWRKDAKAGDDGGRRRATRSSPRSASSGSTRAVHRGRRRRASTACSAWPTTSPTARRTAASARRRGVPHGGGRWRSLTADGVVGPLRRPARARRRVARRRPRAASPG